MLSGDVAELRVLLIVASLCAAATEGVVRAQRVMPGTPPSAITHSRLSPELCANPVYLKMRLERLSEFATSGHDPAATFRAECAAVLKR